MAMRGWVREKRKPKGKCSQKSGPGKIRAEFRRTIGFYQKPERLSLVEDF